MVEDIEYLRPELEIHRLLDLEPTHERNVELLERVADLQARLGNKSEAGRVYDTALERTTDRAAKKRLRDKKARL